MNIYFASVALIIIALTCFISKSYYKLTKRKNKYKPLNELVQGDIIYLKNPHEYGQTNKWIVYENYNGSERIRLRFKSMRGDFQCFDYDQLIDRKYEALNKDRSKIKL